MTYLITSKALAASVCLLLVSGSATQSAATGTSDRIPIAAFADAAVAGRGGAAAPGTQLAETKGRKAKTKKPKLITVTKARPCGVELGKTLKDMPFPAFINKLAAVKVATRVKVRGRWRRVVKVDIPAHKIRRRVGQLYRRADKINDSRRSNRAKLNAITLFITNYEAGLESLRKLRLVENPTRDASGRGHTTMRQSLGVLRVWQREFEAALAPPAKKKNAKGSACKPVKWPGFGGRWIVNANGFTFVMQVAMYRRNLRGTFRGLTKKDPSTSQIRGLVGKLGLFFSRYSTRNPVTQHYSGTLYWSKKGRWIVGDFRDKGKSYQWCAIDARLIKRAEWGRFVCIK